jgi:uncharacterized protein with HEPN domain
LSRPDRERLADIRAACDAITAYVVREGVDDDIVFDAIRVRLIEIGEAVKDIDSKLLTSEPGIPWTEISRMRDQLAHRYFDTTHSIVRNIRLDRPHRQPIVRSGWQSASQRRILRRAERMHGGSVPESRRLRG